MAFKRGKKNEQVSHVIRNLPELQQTLLVTSSAVEKIVHGLCTSKSPRELECKSSISRSSVCCIAKKNLHLERLRRRAVLSQADIRKRLIKSLTKWKTD